MSIAGGGCPSRSIRVRVTGAGTARIVLRGTSGKTVVIRWGDGSVSTVAFASTESIPEHVYAQADTTVLTISGALSDITSLSLYSVTGVTLTLLLHSLASCRSLTVLRAHCAEDSMDVIRQLPVTSLYITGSASNVTGALESFEGKAWTYVSMNSSGVVGDLDVFSGCTALTAFKLLGTGIRGDFAGIMASPLSIINLSNIVALSFSEDGPTPVLSANVSITCQGSNMSAASISNLLKRLAESATVWESPSLNISGNDVTYSQFTQDGQEAYDMLVSSAGKWSITIDKES